MHMYWLNNAFVFILKWNAYDNVLILGRAKIFFKIYTWTIAFYNVNMKIWKKYMKLYENNPIPSPPGIIFVLYVIRFDSELQIRCNKLTLDGENIFF